LALSHALHQLLWPLAFDLSRAKSETGKKRSQRGQRVITSVSEQREMLTEVDLEVEELIDAGDQVVAVTRERGVGRGSGVLVRSIAVSVWTLEDGKVIQVQVFDDRQHGLEAVGLRE
jgi:ketosteroid isomerase-like protein